MARTPDRRPDSGKTGSEDLARIIRERREALGLSRQQLAEASGIPYPTIAQIETAYRGVSPARLGVIARVLGLDPKELYDVLATESAEPAGGVAGATSWHANPRFAAAAVAAPAPVAASSQPARRRAAGPRSDVATVVAQTVELLASLPSAVRIEALGQVQQKVMDGILAERTAVRDDRPPG